MELFFITYLFNVSSIDFMGKTFLKKRFSPYLFQKTLNWIKQTRICVFFVGFAQCFGD